MSEQDTLRMVAELLDKTSGPLKEIQKALKETSEATKRLHGDGAKQATEHNERFKHLHETVGRFRTGITGALMPAMAALGITTFGVGEALSKLVEGLKEAGQKYNLLHDASQRSGLSPEKISSLSIAFERLGISQDAAVKGAAAFGEHMDKLARGTNAEENLSWTTKLGGAYQALGHSLMSIPTREGQLAAVFKFFDEHPNIPVDQRTKFYEEILSLPPELATKSGEEIKKALEAGAAYVKEHPPNMPMFKALDEAFSKLREAQSGFKDDMVDTFGEKGIAVITFFADKIKMLGAEIKSAAEPIHPIDEEAFKKNHPYLNWFAHPTEGFPGMPSLPRAAPDAGNGKDAFVKGTNQFYKPISFGGSSSDNALTEAIKNGMLAAFREWFASTQVGGIQNAALTSSGEGTGMRQPRFGNKDFPDQSDNPALGGTVATSFDRSRFAKELAEKPWLKEKLFHIAAGENRDPLANQMVMESAMNRAVVRGTSLEAQLRRHAQSGKDEHGYYAGYAASISDKLRAIEEANLAKVLANSNESNHATDNSSGSLAAREKASGSFKWQRDRNGESFFSPGTREPLWRKRHNDLLENARKAGMTGSAGTQKVEGDASLKIDLNGFPKGAKTDLTYGGLFTQYTLSRGQQMEASELK